MSREEATRVVQRRDGVLLEAALRTDHPASSDSVPVLVIGGEAFARVETDGYLLDDADPGEAAELRRWGYELAPARPGHA